MVSCELTDVPRLMQKLAPSIWHVSIFTTPYFVFHSFLDNEIRQLVLLREFMIIPGS